MSSGQITAIIIVSIIMIASIIRAGARGHYRAHRIEGPDTETLRLRDEVKALQERIKVLERITVDKENSLSNEIESLRDR
jgi:hypothetical protein